MKIAIVVPCHKRPTDNWINALEREARDGGADVIVVDDSDGQLGALPESWRIFDYAKQEKVLGDLYEEFAKIFHKSSSCRIFGHILAYRENYDAVIGLDSDCNVPFGFVKQHISLLNMKGAYGWSNPFGGSGWFPRGYPYSMRNWRIVANMGVWDNVLDINGKDRKPGEPKRMNALSPVVAVNSFPFSGMNFALLREAIPGFLFLPNFDYETARFRRIDDIWGGYIFQKLARMRKESCIFGPPIVFHDTVVVPEEDAAEEKGMYDFEDDFFAAVDRSLDFHLPVNPTYAELFGLFEYEFRARAPLAFRELIPAMQWWLKAIK